jgi:hypothetical protein
MKWPAAQCDRNEPAHICVKPFALEVVKEVPL